MTEKKELKRCNHLEAIRLLTGMFNPEHAVTILAMVNLIARHYKKLDSDIVEVDEDFFAEQMSKIGMDIYRE